MKMFSAYSVQQGYSATERLEDGQYVMEERDLYLYLILIN